MSRAVELAVKKRSLRMDKSLQTCLSERVCFWYFHKCGIYVLCIHTNRYLYVFVLQNTLRFGFTGSDFTHAFTYTFHSFTKHQRLLNFSFTRIHSRFPCFKSRFKYDSKIIPNYFLLENIILLILRKN